MHGNDIQLSLEDKKEGRDVEGETVPRRRVWG